MVQVAFALRKFLARPSNRLSVVFGVWSRAPGPGYHGFAICSRRAGCAASRIATTSANDHVSGKVICVEASGAASSMPAPDTSKLHVC